jgi:hypothetical protein
LNTPILYMCSYCKDVRYPAGLESALLGETCLMICVQVPRKENG